MRKKRLSAILTIIRENEIENQDMLIDHLRKLGYDVTQATVSRDINDLRLEKNVSLSGVSCYHLPGGIPGANTKLSEIFALATLGVDTAMNTVVIHCYAGLAGAACSAVDAMCFEEAVCTVAGDDTIFVMTKSESEAKKLAEKLNALTE